MTNAQMAHKMGIDKVAAPGYAYKDMLVRSGMNVINEEVSLLDLTCYEATKETSCGTLHIFCGTNGTARIDKPNGTHKWVYEKTPNQISALLRQTMEFYK
jgi:hypothetical protein